MKRITGNYESEPKDALQSEADSRGLKIEGTGANGAVVKDDIVMALQIDDENKEPEQPKSPLPKLQASPIPQVDEVPEVSNVLTGGAPSDEDYTDGIFVKRDGEFSGEDYALAIHDADTYGKTHSLKNSRHFFQCTDKEFRESFEKK